jgi:SH3-like domain-containing protein
MDLRFARIVSVLAVVLAASLAGGQAGLAQGRGADKAPHFVSLRSDEVNLRTGPGVTYPVEWIIKRRNMPVEVLTEFETWRKIRDFEGTEGWVHQSMLSPRRSMIVVGETRPLRRAPEGNATAVARIEPGVVGSLIECKDQWCRVEVAGFKGWMARAQIWGVYPNETIR